VHSACVEPLRVNTRGVATACSKAHVMVFMKGTPQEAKCKFSRKVVRVFLMGRSECTPHKLRGVVPWAWPTVVHADHQVGLLTTAGVTFSAFNILNDDAVRQGLKKFSSWPTFPQVRNMRSNLAYRVVYHGCTSKTHTACSDLRRGQVGWRPRHSGRDGFRRPDPRIAACPQHEQYVVAESCA